MTDDLSDLTDGFPTNDEHSVRIFCVTFGSALLGGAICQLCEWDESAGLLLGGLFGLLFSSYAAWKTNKLLTAIKHSIIIKQQKIAQEQNDQEAQMRKEECREYSGGE